MERTKAPGAQVEARPDVAHSSTRLCACAFTEHSAWLHMAASNCTTMAQHRTCRPQSLVVLPALCGPGAGHPLLQSAGRPDPKEDSGPDAVPPHFVRHCNRNAVRHEAHWWHEVSLGEGVPGAGQGWVGIRAQVMGEGTLVGRQACASGWVWGPRWVKAGVGDGWAAALISDPPPLPQWKKTGGSTGSASG